MALWKRFDPPRIWQALDQWGKGFELEVFWDAGQGHAPGLPTHGRRVSAYGRDGERAFSLEGWSKAGAEALERELWEEAERRLADDDWETGETYRM